AGPDGRRRTEMNSLCVHLCSSVVPILSLESDFRADRADLASIFEERLVRIVPRSEPRCDHKEVLTELRDLSFEGHDDAVIVSLTRSTHRGERRAGGVVVLMLVTVPDLALHGVRQGPAQRDLQLVGAVLEFVRTERVVVHVWHAERLVVGVGETHLIAPP